jgi:hypothetical protein
MEQISEFNLNFSVDHDFEVHLAGQEQAVKIPRMLFRTGKKVLALFSKPISENRAYVIRILGKAREADMRMDSKTYDSYANMVKEVFPVLMESANYGVIEELLITISEGAITEKIISGMKYVDVVQLATFLIERNFEPLKKFYASFEAITTSPKQDKV